LLILSTLTSDGTVNIAGYLIDLYRYDGLEPDLVVLDGNLFKEAVCEMLRIASCFPRMLTA